MRGKFLNNIFDKDIPGQVQQDLFPVIYLKRCYQTHSSIIFQLKKKKKVGDRKKQSDK